MWEEQSKRLKTDGSGNIDVNAPGGAGQSSTEMMFDKDGMM